MIHAFRRHFFLTVFLLFSLLSNAQIDDVGLRLGVSINKQVTRNAEISITEQIRFQHDVSTIDQVLTDFGFEYSFSKSFRAGFYYRFINKNQDNYYSKRHRIYVNLAYRYKINSVTLTLRGRIQEQYTDVYSSETGKIPTWIVRGRLAARFDLKKKYTPYVSGEVYYLLDNARERDNFVTRIRYEIGFDYEFNRVNSINPYILHQTARLTGFTELIYGVSYGFSF